VFLTFVTEHTIWGKAGIQLPRAFTFRGATYGNLRKVPVPFNEDSLGQYGRW